jgi:hypothetical protein
MTHFTSWDINLILCLISWGVPDDVVSTMLKMAKKVHEEYSLGEAMTYWVGNAPTLVKMAPSASARRGPFPRFKFCVPNVSRQNEIIEVWKNRFKNIAEFKTEWRLRSIEERHGKVIEWCKFGEEEAQLRHQYRLKNIRNNRKRWEDYPNYYDEEYAKNLWRTWEAGASSYYFVGWDRRKYVAHWYEENRIIQERNMGVPRGPCEDGYRFPQTPIFDKGPYEQLIEDLRCIDGPGLGETGSHIEHIDDLFLD